ncbi:MAG: hypothetical protein JNL08_19920 [Planctomycetes bacterium]|nr:hypothetical protein [Planctomycetota bacterium]
MNLASRCHAMCWAPFVVAAALGAQDGAQERLVSVTVTSVGEQSVYLDAGRDQGLRIGTTVRLFAPGVGEVEVEVRSVSATSARAEVPPGVPLPPVGTRGEARVTVAAEPVRRPAVAPQPPVEHPPWTRQEPVRAPDQPLLVPTYGQRPDERPADLQGRLFATGQWNRDLGAGRDSDYLLARLGVRADATNHFGVAERVRFAGEVADRRVLLADAPDQVDDTGRLDLLSVAFGTEHWAPTGVEIGRFLSPHLPEIGLVDGVEVVRRMQGGVRFGAGVGAYPRPFPSHETGEDTGVHVFFDYTADVRRTFAFGLGAQKTWHHGDPDRDLLLLRAEGRLGDRVRAYGSAKVDVYTGSDTVETSDLELTEALATVQWDAGGGSGVSVTGSHFAWPELERAEYQALPVELVRDGHVDRVGLRGWLRPWQWLRLAGRADAWRDQDRNGDHLGLDADIAGPLGAGSSLGMSVFVNDGGYSAGPGARVSLRGPLGAGSWRLGYRWYRYELADLVSGPESYTRQSIELGASVPLGDHCDFDVAVERWFGDREDAFALDLYLQWRF